jgi:hypothetical protein
VTEKCANLKDKFDIDTNQDRPDALSEVQEKQIVDILKAVNSIWTGVGQAVATAASIGAVTGGISAYGQARNELNASKENKVIN